MVASDRFHQWRLLTLCTIFASCAILLVYRVYVHQVVEYDRYAALASDEHDFKKEIVPRRGDILDRNGNPLAVSVMYQSLYAYPPRVKDPEATADKLAPILGEPRDSLLSELRSSKSVVALKQKLPLEVSTKIANLALPGTFLLQEPFRGYPEGNIAPQILGFVGKDFQGLAGLELSLDSDLGGVPGLLDAEKDTSGSEIAIGRKELIPPKDGSDAILTIDRYIQRVAERELAAAVKENKASGGLIIIMDPKTGEILAAANQPTYDLTAEEVYDPSKPALYKPTIATDFYEPGSVMKLVTMSSAIQEGLVNPDTTFNDTGIAVIDGAVIRNWDFGAPGTESMTQVLINSSNIGAQWVAAKLGPEKFYRYVDAFGFGKPTGVELPGEVSGLVRTPSDPTWGRIDLATNAFGQGIAVTPLQMITAVAAIANDGILPKPMFVKGYRDGDNFREVPPVQVRRVMSSETARKVTDMMVHVVEDNSLRLAVVPGYKIAGKTGTADLPTLSGYNTSVTYGSQIGFAPVADPRFIILVRLDGAEKLYGGQVASPVFKRLAQQLFEYMNIPPTEPMKPRATSTPVRPASAAELPAVVSVTPSPSAQRSPVPSPSPSAPRVTPAPAAPSPTAMKTRPPVVSTSVPVVSTSIPVVTTALPARPAPTPGR